MNDRIALMIFSGVAAAAGLLWFVRSFRDRRVQRLIQDTPTARIRSMAMGMVELNGHVQPRSTTIAPFSGRSCVYWEVDIATRSGAKRNRTWSIVHRNQSGHPFFLTDETGTALVYPKGSECRLPFGVEETTIGPFGFPECYAEYMKRSNLGMSAMWRMGQMRFRERTIDEGQRLYVLGRAHPKAQATTLAMPDEDVLESTGTADLRASRIARADQDVRGVIRRDSSDPVLLLSLNSERGVATEYMLRALAGSVLGPLLFVGGTAFLLWLMGQP